MTAASPLRFAVVGAGAIGAYVGAALARGGSEVVLIARGAHLRAMQEHGVRTVGPSPAVNMPQDDPKAALEKLKEMLDAGLINQQDYEKKKAEILARM